MESIATAIGLIGVVIVLITYGMLTLGKMGENEPRYYWLNIAGTVGIAISLLVQWNLSSMVSQILWIVVSIIGLLRIRWRHA
jgi:hypothetical protein